MEYVISIGLSVISSVLAFMLNNSIKDNKELREAKEKEANTRDNAITEAILCLLRVKLIEYHDKYISEGHIPSYAYENWAKMYKVYIALGGNGLIKGMDVEIEKLPII
jgi:hypothetical protein